MKLKDFNNPETERLEFKQTSMADVAHVFALRSSPIVRKYIEQPLFTTEDEAVTHIKKLEGYQKNNQSINWILVDRVLNKKIGSICLWNFSKDRKTAEVGYDLLPDYFKKGYMSEALQAVIKFGFNNLKLNTIEAYTHVDNESSKKLLKVNGFEWQPEKKDPEFSKNRVFVLSK